MKQKILTLLLVFMPLMASADESGTCGYHLTGTYEEATQTLTITGGGAMTNFNSYMDGAWYNFRDQILKISLDSRITSIGNWAFYGCSGLTSITIPDGVTSIGQSAFHGCSGLTSITIGDGVTSIGPFAFEGCSGLTSITIPDGVTSILDDAFQDCSGLTSITIGNGLTCIDYGAFSNCSGLTSVTIGNGVTSIGPYAFRGCSGLTSITIPDGVTSIGDDAFQDCSGLTSITIGNGLTSIGYQAFSGCSGLTSITIGKSVTSIWNNAFSNCTSLEEVYIYAENLPSSKSNIFSNSPINQAVLYAPAIHLNSYRESSPWSGFKYIFPIEGSYAERCAKPTISIKDGEIVFECETPDASYVSSYEILNSSTTTDNKMSLPNRFRISVYAQKYGLLDSPMATAEVETTIGKRGDLNDDGVLNAADVVKLTNMIMNQE